MFKVSIILIFLPFFLTYFFVLKIKPFLIKYLLDEPNHRSSHKMPKPTGGGISFVIISTILMPFVGNFLPLYCLPLAIAGFIDDIKSTNFKIRYLIQFLTGLLIIFQSNYLIKVDYGNNLFIVLVSYIFLAFCITSVINFSNFVDGLDGLLSSCYIVIFTIAAFKTDLSVFVLVSSLYAFLIWNWHPSKLFMGDVGSTFLGAVYAGLIFNADNIRDSLIMILPSIPILLDAFICVIRRLFARENIFKAHSLHLFQRLYQAGWSHSKISTYYLFSTLVVGICSLLDILFAGIFTLLIIFIFGYYLDQKVAVSFINSIAISKSNKSI